jgi:hypothetical protein
MIVKNEEIIQLSGKLNGIKRAIIDSGTYNKKFLAVKISK